MFNLMLVNLTPDALRVSVQAHHEMRNVTPDALRGLLYNFCEIDPIENAAGDTEIRVDARNEKYLLRTEQRKVVLYDINRRDLPGQLLTVEQTLVELDGTAAAARRESVLQARALTTAPFLFTPPAPTAATAPVASKPRVIAWSVTITALLVANLWLVVPGWLQRRLPAGFEPVAGDESERVYSSLAGVYLTGSEPGQHGIVVTAPGELKLFELHAVDAPRVVYATFRVGRIDGRLHLLTDQPGGLIEVEGANVLSYCGETYARLP